MGKLNTEKLFMILLGPPGIGKGTFGRLLSKEYNYEKITTGDLLRKEYKAFTDTMSKGLLVSDDVLFKLVTNKLVECTTGLILDGFPRNNNQTHYLLDIAAKLNSTILTINLTLNKTHLINRLLGRRVCELCNRAYNITSINDGEYIMGPLLPTQEDLISCTGCNDLKTRSDDTVEVIEKRLEIYYENFDPIIKLLSKSPMINFEVKRGIDDFDSLKSMVYEYLH